MKVAFLTNIISPYRLPVFERLAATPGWQFRVIVNAASEFDRAWQFQAKSLDWVPTRSVPIRRKVLSREPIAFEQIITLHLPIGLWPDLRRFRPDVVISHELGPRSMIAAAYCAAHRAPLVIWAYQSRVSATQGQRRRLVRRWLLRRAAVAVGMGTQAREVLRHWGKADHLIVDAPNSADHETLLGRFNDPQTPGRADQIRSRWPDCRRIALVVGRLVPLKGTDAILRTWQALPAPLRKQWRLVFVGEGPLACLIDEANDPSIDRIGHVASEEMVDWYAASDLHIFPTLGDVWGLVVHEAMMCGLPTLCSIHAGCSDDMIRDAENGLLFDPTDQSGAVATLRAALVRTDLPALGSAAKKTAARFTLDGLAEGFRRAVHMAVPSSIEIGSRNAPTGKQVA